MYDEIKFIHEAKKLVDSSSNHPNFKWNMCKIENSLVKNNK